MSNIKVNCKNCSKEFLARKQDLKRGHAKYCSRACFVASNKGRRKKHQPNVSCAYCTKPFYKSPSKISKSKSGLHFCCREHKDLAQRIGGIKEIQPSHYKTGAYTYRKKALRDLPRKCNKCGYKKYPEVLVVHHINRDRKDSSLDNLEVLCPTCHQEDHFLAKDGRFSSLSS